MNIYYSRIVNSNVEKYELNILNFYKLKINMPKIQNPSPLPAKK